MRHALPLIFRAIPAVIALLPLASAHAQAPAQQPAPQVEKAPIQEFNLEQALVSSQGGLTADDAGRQARARSLQVVSANAAAESAEWDRKNAINGFVPTVQLGAQYRRISFVDNTFSTTPTITPEQAAMLAPETITVLSDLAKISEDQPSFTQPQDQYGLTASLKIPVSDMLLRVWPAKESAKFAVEARKLQAEAAGEQIELATKLVFYDYANAVAQHAVQQQALVQAEALAAQTKLFVDAGTKAPVEYMQASAELERQRGELARIEGAVSIARARLAVAMGVDPSTIQAIGENITQLPELPPQPLNELVSSGVEKRTELRALEKALGMNRQLEKSERNAAWPQLVLDANGIYANPNPRYVPPRAQFRGSWDVGASIVWTPNQVLTGRARGNKFEAETAKARADLEAMREQVQVEVIQAYENLRSAILAAQAQQAGVAAAEEAYRVRLATYRVGAGVLIDLITADNTVTAARSRYVIYVIQARMALAQLRRNAVL